jgi:hypothetical protein
MTEPEAWLAFVEGCQAWAEHLGDVERIKFQTPRGYVYVAIMRETKRQGRFDEVNEDGDIVGRDKAA